MSSRHLLINSAAALVACVTMGFSTSAMAAFDVLKVVEDPVKGFFGSIPTSSPAIMVGSDGEAHFDPFGAGFDVSDGIILNADWIPDPTYAAAFTAGHWTQLPGSFTWVLPACFGGVCENGAVKEPIGKWLFKPGSGWNPGTMSIAMYDNLGVLSDLVTVANDGPGGGATITFNSGNFGVPEPGAWVMMTIGLGGMGMVLRSRRRPAIASA